MSDFTAGEPVLIDRSLKAEFLRYVRPGDANAIVRIGLDTRIVEVGHLSTQEA